jgi:putative colanic acid biosynthesis UDP-glucose lipid carrier transferase
LLSADSPHPGLRAASLKPGAAASSWRKRALDVVGASAALILFLPLMLAIALAIGCESPGPVFFRQQRTGLHGRRFTILKFRTMYVEPEGAEVRQARFGDRRVTNVGRVLRKLSIDELPQLINVLKGEMSLVGPRPHALSHDAQWSVTAAGYAERFRVRPGLTGLAQVRGLRGEIVGDEGVHLRVAADNEYIDSWSFAGDLQLLLRTVPLVLNDPKAY